MAANLRKVRARPWLIGLVLVVLIVGGGGAWWFLQRDTSAAAASPAVVTRSVAASVGNIQSAVTASGTVTPAVQESVSFGASGRVTAVEVSQGDKVAKGQRLLTLEAMKMEHALVAPFDGTVAELAATPGAQVREGAVLAKIVPDE